MNSRGTRTIWGSILRKKRRAKKMSIRSTTKRGVGLQNLGSRGGSPVTKFVQQWSSVGPRSTPKFSRFGTVCCEILWGIGGEGRGVFKGQDFVDRGQPE